MEFALDVVERRWMARQLLPLWDAPEVVRLWIDKGDASVRHDAKMAAWDYAAAEILTDKHYAATTAATAAEPVTTNPESVALTRDTLHRFKAAHGYLLPLSYTCAVHLLNILPSLLRQHGLAARLLDEVRKDPWLTREVVRALSLPDLAVWEDWCSTMVTSQQEA